jgi:hypothetical protein
VILTQQPRPSISSPQCAVTIPDATAGRFNVPTCDRSTAFALTPYRSQSYKCPLPQPLSFDNHTNARGVGGTLALLHSFVALCVKCVSQLFCNQALPHSFSKLPGCHPTIPILARPELRGERIPAMGTRPFQLSTIDFQLLSPLSHQSPVRRTCIRCTIGANLSLGQTVHGSPFRTFILCGRV